MKRFGEYISHSSHLGYVALCSEAVEWVAGMPYCIAAVTLCSGIVFFFFVFFFFASKKLGSTKQA